MQNPRLTLLALASVVFVLIVNSCVSHNLAEADITVDCNGAQTISFNSQVKPILSSNCAISGCHNGSLGPDRDWTNASTFKDHAAEARRRVQLSKANPDHMPRVGSISLEQIQTIVCWVDQGANINN
jgi:hypothetical protein